MGAHGSRPSNSEDNFMSLQLLLRHKAQTPRRSDSDPAIAQTCGESCAVALLHHDLAFRMRIGRPIYFNYNADTLSFGNEDALANFWYWGRYEKGNPVIAERMVKRLCIQTEFQGIPRIWYHQIAEYHNLKKLTIEYLDHRNEYPLNRDSVMSYFKRCWTEQNDFHFKFRGVLWPQDTELIYGGHVYELQDEVKSE
jgi:hypothetical protein